jgi:putative MATE family efflux protein
MKTSIKYSEIWIIAYPIILGSIAQNLLNITDTAFLGRVSMVALGAGAIGGIFYLISSMLAWGFGIGTQIIIARRRGEMAFQAIGPVFQHGFYFQMPLALTLFSIMQFYAPDILKNIIESREVYQASLEFIHYRSYGIFFAGANMLFRGFYVGIARTKIITFTTAFMAGVNVILDYALIFGKFGFPAMGIGGAALASVIAEFSATAFFAVYTFFILNGRQYNLYRLARFDRSLYRRMILLALPVMAQNFLSMASWLVFFLFVEKLGEQALAVSNIIRSYYIVLMVPMWGFASATNTLVSGLVGQDRRDEVLSLVAKIVRLCMVMVLVLVALGTMFPQIALRIYTNDPALIDISLPVLYVVSVAAVGLAAAFILFNGVSGTGKTQVSFGIEVITIVIYLFYTYLLADFLRMEIHFVWTAEILYAVLLAGFSFAYLRSGKWRGARY